MVEFSDSGSRKSHLVDTCSRGRLTKSRRARALFIETGPGDDSEEMRRYMVLETALLGKAVNLSMTIQYTSIPEVNQRIPRELRTQVRAFLRKLTKNK